MLAVCKNRLFTDRRLPQPCNYCSVALLPLTQRGCHFNNLFTANKNNQRASTHPITSIQRGLREDASRMRPVSPGRRDGACPAYNRYAADTTKQRHIPVCCTALYADRLPQIISHLTERRIYASLSRRHKSFSPTVKGILQNTQAYRVI